MQNTDILPETAVSGPAARGAAVHFRSLQMLRAGAAYAVLLFHLKLLHLGYAGVDVFFVLSGFIMGTMAPREGPRRFLLRRVIRVVPLYWLVTLVFCAAALVPGLFRHFVFNPVDLLRSLAFIPYYSTDGQIWPIVVPGWTLNYEMLFYGLMALCLTTPRPVPMLVGLLLALVAVGAWFPQQTAPGHVATGPLLLEFAGGLVLSMVYGRLPGLAGLAALVGGAVWLALCSRLVAPEMGEMMRVAVLGVPSLLLVGGALAVEQAGWAIPGSGWLARALEKMGDASYSLYLLHPLLLSAVERATRNAPHLRVALALIACTAAALACHALFERPVG
ncbi:MAG TPA: acyltransferase, partial [Novosphingobium sp.]|nr:acyltransferase [Novosphingobium sp.]